jgi:TonB-linked SusC/RagA family outer membrane protein
MKLKIAIFIIMVGVCNVFAENPYSVIEKIKTDSESQQNLVTGIITDATTGGAMPGVNIQVKGTTAGTISDIAGKYSLSVPDRNATLIFSFIGYVTQEVQLNGRSSVAVALAAVITGLDEVVVIGYGTQKKVNLTGAVTALNVDETMASRAVSNVSTSLSGMASGLTVSQNTGMAGSDESSLVIRGLGSPNESSPLIVVDGIPDVNINKLNINDIESISVLKDAASAAIYGSRAANGVILVTTKRGSTGKVRLNYTGSFSLQTLTNYYDALADYPQVLEFHNMSLMNAGKARRFADGTIEQWMAMENLDPIRFPNTDWWDVIYKNGLVQNHSLSASGGTEKMNFYVSAGQMTDNGVSLKSDYRRNNFRTNLDYFILDKLRMGVNVDGTWTKQNYPTQDGITDMDASSPDEIFKQTPGVTVMDEQGRYGGHMAYMENNLSRNQYANLITKNNIIEEQGFIGKVYGEWEPVEGLIMHIDYSLNYLNYFKRSWGIPFIRYNFQTDTPLDVITSNGGISNNFRNQYKTLFQGHISYDKEIFSGHRVSAIAVYSEEYWFSRTLNGSRQDRIHPDLAELNAALNDRPATSGTSSGEGLRSVIGRINYNIHEKYLFEANLRADASSKFLPGYQWGVFPSFSLGWRLSQESFFEPLKQVVTNAKIRGSWGMLGNNSGVGRYEQREAYTVTNYAFGQKLNFGTSSNRLINYDFTWEKTKVINLGLDLTFYKKLTAEIDFYDRLTSDIIRNSELSTILSSNYSAPNTNIGELQNRGVELNLVWKDNINTLDYGFRFSYSTNRNKLISWNQRLGYGVPFLNYPFSFAYSYVSTGKAQTWDDVLNAPYQGNDYFAPGDVLCKDINGDGQITGDDRVAFRNSPRTFFNNQFSLIMDARWKNFDASILFQAFTGSKAFWLDWFNRVYPNDSRYQYNEVHLDNWNLNNRNSTLTRLVIGTGGNNERESTYWLYKRNYLRMKNIQIGYTIPNRILEKVKVTNLRIYFTGENLLTLTKWPGVDPEKNPGTTRRINPYPLLKSYALGINLTL